MISNEAAERLRERLRREPINEYELIDAALAAERRATVERIRARLNQNERALLDLILDEAARND